MLWVVAALWARLIMMFRDKAINTHAPTGEDLIVVSSEGFWQVFALFSHSVALPAWIGGLFVTARALQAYIPGEFKSMEASEIS